jgi:hypothetical protein
MPYIDVPIETEPVDLADEAFAYIEGQVPGWLPSPGNLESWLVESLAQLASELRQLAALVPQSIFGFFGETVLGLPPYPAVQATAPTTWTAIDATGYHVDAGTLVGLTPPASSTAFAFEVATAFDIPAGQTSIGGMTIRSVQGGSAASGLTGNVELLDGLDFISGIVLDSPTVGGSDPESDGDYLNRLSDLMTLLSPRTLLPQDFAVLAQQRNPSVARATAIDLYDLSTGATNVPRCVTVALIDTQGNPVPAEVKADVNAMLQAEREVNFLVFVGDPTYTTVDVTAAVVVYPDYDPAQVATLVQASLTGYLSPANWGLPPFGDTHAKSWISDDEVRYLEVAEQINRTDGVWYITGLSIGRQGDALANADVSLDGVAPLPKPGAINVSAAVVPG